MTTAERKLTIADLKRAADKFGATVEQDGVGRYASYTVVAPENKAWACNGDITMITIQWRVSGSRPDKYERAEKHEAIKDAIERMSHGLCDHVCNDCGKVIPDSECNGWCEECFSKL